LPCSPLLSHVYSPILSHHWSPFSMSYYRSSVAHALVTTACAPPLSSALRRLGVSAERGTSAPVLQARGGPGYLVHASRYSFLQRVPSYIVVPDVGSMVVRSYVLRVWLHWAIGKILSSAMGVVRLSLLPSRPVRVKAESAVCPFLPAPACRACSETHSTVETRDSFCSLGERSVSSPFSPPRLSSRQVK
jgi:hypothetical protein